MIKHKRDLENKNKSFPFKSIRAERTINEWINLFDWENARLELMEEESTEIGNVINEFNINQIKRKSKRVDRLNNTLDALHNIITTLSMDLYTQTPKGQLFNATDVFKSTSAILTQLGYLYNTLEKLHNSGTISVNTFGEYIKDWTKSKEALEYHYNKYTTSEEYLKEQIQAIDYYFDNYVEN